MKVIYLVITTTTNKSIKHTNESKTVTVGDGQILWEQIGIVFLAHAQNSDLAVPVHPLPVNFVNLTRRALN